MSSLFAAVEWPFGIAAGTAVGGAVAGGITPVVQDIINEAWSAHPDKPLAAAVAALLAAEDYQGGHADAAEAAFTGYNGTRFAALTEAQRLAPDVDTLLALWRRGLVTDAVLDIGLAKLKLRPEFKSALKNTKDVLLSPAELANARQQEFIDDGRLHSEGLLQGYTNERMDLLFKMAGLPPGAMDGLELLRRGIIDETTYREIVAEGHTKTKYTDDLLALRNRILTAPEWAGLWLRGWVTQAEAEAGGALDGYDPAAMLNLYRNRGRPATPRQVHLGYARGATLPGAANEEEAITRAVQESDIRTEWRNIEDANKWSYPSPFVMRQLTQSGAFTEAQSEQVLIEMGWKPQYAKLAATAWASSPAAATTKPLLKRSQSRLFTTLHNAYVRGQIDRTAALLGLGNLGATQGEADEVLLVWDYEATLPRTDLTRTEVLKFYRTAEWTRVQAFDWLTERGLPPDEANELLDSV